MNLTREDVWIIVRDTIAEVASGNGIDPEDITRESQASELGLSSVDTIHTMIILEERLGDDIDLESLVMRNGEYASDLSLSELHEHLCRRLAATA
jgi:acyl carrier protein